MNTGIPTVFALFADAAARHPQGAFMCVLPETAAAYGITAGEISYDAALAATLKLSEAYAKAGYGAGQRVGMLLENRPAFFRHWFALNRLGVSVVPINPDLRAAELEYVIEHSEMIAAVVVPGRRGDLENAARAMGRALALHGPEEEPQPLAVRSAVGGLTSDTECALLYTSGTTGRPKGCVLANEYFLAAGEWYATTGGMITLEDSRERMITPLPVFHMNAMAYSAMAMLRTAGCLVTVDRFHPKSWWYQVRESRATILHYLGVMPAILMTAPADATDRDHSVRFGFGAGVERSLHASFEERFGFPLIEAWAMTETGAGAVVVANHEPRRRGTNSFGRAGNDIELRLVLEDGGEAPDETPGELLVRHSGPNPRYGFFREYLKDEAATTSAWEGGWFHTGDIIVRATDGSLRLVDRKKNIIRRSGENISAVEVESELLQHPSVRQVAVAATPDPVRGDEVLALIVPDDTSAENNETARTIVEWCLLRLAYYKAPGWIAFVPSLPLTGTQKIQRGSVKDLAADYMARGACIDLRHLKKRASPVAEQGR
jgi:acyl-CoA synthetase (AMP-forming)/AMP-acid ligase II